MEVGLNGTTSSATKLYNGNNSGHELVSWTACACPAATIPASPVTIQTALESFCTQFIINSAGAQSKSPSHKWTALINWITY